MAVSDQVRKVESEIDASIRALPIWQAPRSKVLEQLIYTYRDAIELTFCRFLHAKAFDSATEDLGVAFEEEDLIRGGILWALKWASEYCPKSGIACTNSPDELVHLIFLGKAYETFVDALKYAQKDLAKIEVDEISRIISCYEGGDVTGFDAHIVQQQHILTPITPHSSLTEDGDQLTSQWSAGDYRRVVRILAEYAASQENTILVDPDLLSQIGKPEISISQPTVVWLNRPGTSTDCHVFDDLVLPTVIDSQIKWKIVSLLETPIIRVGDSYCTLSSDIKAISKIDDYMLRLAARVDEKQYSLVSGMRENRMIQICKRILECCSRPWIIKENVNFNNPSQEADILATRDSDSFILELKSTLRPETPWEVHKRNEDIICGIKQTKDLIDRGTARHGFLVTDGYYGDYKCWSEALIYNIPIATLYDLEVIANDPINAICYFKNRLGINEFTRYSRERLADRQMDLLNWKLRIVDMNIMGQTHR